MHADNDNLVQTKVCTRCGATQPIDNYYAKKDGKDGLHSWCKQCCSEYKAAWLVENKEGQKARIEQWRKDNPEKVSEYGRRWAAKNPEKVKERTERYRENSPDKYKEKERRAYEKRRSKPGAKLEDSMRAGMTRGLAKGIKGNRRTFSLLGYTLDELKGHLERLFQPGMSWDNYGLWEVDHIVPLSAFNYETPEDIDFSRAWSLSNLRPLWARDNRKKSNKLTRPFQPSLSLAVNDNTTTTTKKEKKHG